MNNLILEQNTNKFVVEEHRWRHTGTRLEYVSQKIRHTISVFLGEWFLNTAIGIPYIPPEGTSKSMHRRMIETALQVRIGEVDGVEKIITFTSTLDKATRQLSVYFVVRIDSGEIYEDTICIGIGG